MNDYKVENMPIEKTLDEKALSRISGGWCGNEPIPLPLPKRRMMLSAWKTSEGVGMVLPGVQKKRIPMLSRGVKR